MSHLPDVLVRLNKQAVLNSYFAQGDELSDILTDIRIAWGPQQMSWQGFITESKNYIGYPAYGRWHFWSGVPGAATRFYFYTARGWFRLRLHWLMAVLFGALLLLSACVTVEYGNGVTRRRLPIDGEYAHFFRWDWCPHIGWVKSTEATEECRCFDEMGGVLPGCIGNPNVPKIVRDGVVIYDPKDYFKQ